MAVNATPLNSTLVIEYQTGATSTGSPVLRQKSLNYLRSDATEEAVYNVAMALFSLVEHPVTSVLLRRNFELIEEQP